MIEDIIQFRLKDIVDINWRNATHHYALAIAKSIYNYPIILNNNYYRYWIRLNNRRKKTYNIDLLKASYAYYPLYNITHDQALNKIETCTQMFDPYQFIVSDECCIWFLTDADKIRFMMSV